MIWCFFLALATFAADRLPCPALGPARRVPLETMILTVAYQEHRGVFFFEENPQYVQLNELYANLTSRVFDPAATYASSPPTPLTRARYHALLEQNAETSAWIRRKLAFLVGLSLRPSMRLTMRDLTEEARRDGQPSTLAIIPFPADPL